ncbi:MAG: acetate/propionate family kinase [Bacillota bacterium]
MKVLVLNCGSSSVKYQLFEMQDERVLAKGLVERIGLPGALITHRPADRDKHVVTTDIPDHKAAIKLVFAALTEPAHGVVGDVSEIQAIGHRVAHGGDIFPESALVDAKSKEGIRKLIELAPLHNPANLLGIESCEELIPGIRQVAVFDTSFHQTMPEKAFIYSLPYEYYPKYSIRRYGFHGTSHKYVAERAAAMLNRPLAELKIITCHLGNGASIAAIAGGKSVDTSMGFTPLEGLAMGTRCGDIDPAIVTFLMEKEGWTPAEANNVLNKKSGVLGISGVSSDFRDLEEAAEKGIQRARLALDVFVYRVKKYIGAYATALNGLDALVFTAGLGENSSLIRQAVCEGLDYLQMWIDPEKNQVRGKEADVSTDASRGRILVIPTNEELVIARDTAKLVAGA